MTPPSPEALEAARKWTDTMWMRGAGWVEEYEHNMAMAFDAFAAEAVERERRRLGFGEIEMMSEQRNRPGLPPRWCALARGRGKAAIADSEEDARVLALTMEMRS